MGTPRFTAEFKEEAVRQRIRAIRNSSLIRVFERHFIDTTMKSPGRKNVHPPVKLADNEGDLVDDF
ncbi:hypothetical protein QP716_23260 [Citrobacter freundii]|jgi:hypothetical protein|uniref:hypothetical protein n=1 Tax=Enterobacteriaceae TaxID=543 RepID=UPI002551613B|nr:hypothetical protein [Citrobacter freundii]MDK8080655.1 hypothetical protein [Citrobacter freundii]MDK8591681.1 hypothetical protein [Citrobacter freundii]